MEKLTYEEAREWFWIRTLIWLLPAIFITTAGMYWYGGEILDQQDPRLLISLVVGFGTVSIALFCVFLSMRFPWMSAGYWYSFLLTGPVCAMMAGGTAFVFGGLALAAIKNDPINSPPASLMATFHDVLVFGIAASIVWGLVLGVWFSLRRDKYFVEIV